ncbi:hypothetical protein B4589_000480 [Halolamina sp. CBA1230]|uniref:hypothetical protein n=1 Tax=Halolamina sp. CBA1230 TaxID=1853690 RepID=UPI0009A1A007|nr:hypothetical protein [Halolamina sp. CBA1230]QKY18918.1 hypothetical protein B4589_000480 [Halolamina sp. CBA1230]
MTDSPADTDGPPAAAEDDEIDRRRLIRWIALLAFGVPVVVEALTFGNIIGDELLGGGENEAAATDDGTDTATDHADAVGVDDELLPGTAASETVTTSEVRQSDDGRTYVFGVDVENDTDATVELRTRRLRLRDDSAVDGVSSTGPIDPGGSGMMTAAWEFEQGAMPESVECVALRGGETVFEGFVAVERPPVVG